MIIIRLRFFLFACLLLLSPLAAETQRLFDPIAVYLTWLQNPESTMTIQWITATNRNEDTIDYREAGEGQWKSTTGVHVPMPYGCPYLIHRAMLTNLRPDTDYIFRTGHDGVPFKFRTMPDDLKKPIRFIVGGDIYHDNLETLREMNLQAASTNPYFALLGGDITYAADSYGFLNFFGFGQEKITRWMEWLIAWKNQMITPDGRLIPMIPAIGNHDVTGRFGQSPSQAQFFYALFPMPGIQGYNVLDFGDYMSIVILDSGHTHSVEGAQTQWLSQILKEREPILHKFALYHVGAYPSVRRYKGGIGGLVRKYWVPLFDQYGLNAAFEHHDHAYKRTHPMRSNQFDPNGVIYLGDGAWGIDKPRVARGMKEKWYLAKTAPLRHVIVVTIEAGRRVYMAIDAKGNVIDSYAQLLKNQE